MNKKVFQTFLRWIGRRVAGRDINTPEMFFKTAMQCQYQGVNEWQLERCLALYHKEGVIPDFVQRMVRQLYEAFVTEA